MSDTAVQDLLIRIATDPVLARDIAADPGLLTSRFGLSPAQAAQVASTRVDRSAPGPRRLEERLSRSGGVFGSVLAAAVDTYEQKSAEVEPQTAEPEPQPVDPEPVAVQPDVPEPEVEPEADVEVEAQAATDGFQAAVEEIMEAQRASEQPDITAPADQHQDPPPPAETEQQEFHPPKKLDLSRSMFLDENELEGESNATGGWSPEMDKLWRDVGESIEEAPGHFVTGGATDLVEWWNGLFEEEPPDPRTVDSDSDGINDHDERQGGTDPLSADSDWDSIPDGQERAEGTDPTSEDSDRDLMSDAEEWARGTNPMVSDMDGDGYGDGFETRFLGTDPLNADTDGDQLPDRQEIADGTDPLKADSDGDGVPDTFDRPMSATDPLPDLTTGPPPDFGDDTVEYGSGPAEPGPIVK